MRFNSAVAAARDEGGTRLSPDGRWLLYVSNESGQNEVYLRPFPGPDRRWKISTAGGTQAIWNPNGKEIFYRNGDKMMVVDVSTAAEVTLSAPRRGEDLKASSTMALIVGRRSLERLPGPRFSS